MQKRLVMRCRQRSWRGRSGGRTSSLPRNYGTPIIVLNGAIPYLTRVSGDSNSTMPIAISFMPPFAFRPGDEQDPRDERGRVIHDSGVSLVDTWRALEHLVDAGHCNSIGLADVALEKLREIAAVARIKPAVVQVESHPYLPEWDLLDFCREHGIVLLAFAALGHRLSPKVLDDPVITTIARRVHKTPGQVALARAVQRGTTFLTTSTTPRYIQENFEISALPEDAMQEIREGITTNVRFNAAVGIEVVREIRTVR